MQRLAIGGAVLGGAFLAAFLWIGGNLLLVPAEPQVVDSKPFSEQHKAYSPGGKECDPEQLGKILSTAKRDEQSQACADKAEEHRLKIEDLDQQARSAKAAEEVARLTYAQLRLTLAETIFLVMTLGATALAAWAAVVAASATQESVKVAERDLASNRPAILDKMFAVHLVESQGIVFSLTNFGQRNALVEEVRAAFVVTQNFKEHAEPSLAWLRNQPTAAIIGEPFALIANAAEPTKKSLKIQPEHEITREQIAAIERLQSVFQFACRVQYRDHLNTLWEKGFTYQIAIQHTTGYTKSYTRLSGPKHSYDRPIQSPQSEQSGLGVLAP